LARGRIKELGRELLRKDRAWAETAALLVPQKKQRLSSTEEMLLGPAQSEWT
jgi:hypothetical protein